jgi:3-phenylpropionate/trans-cinnamate dioxygenase ferredoxin subunit
MLRRLAGLFRGKGVLVPDLHRLAEGEARKVDVGDPLAGGKQVLLCRVEGRVYALDTLCPHEGARMQTGPLVDGKYARCPLHGYCFDPRDGKAVRVSCRSARTYRVVERDGQAEIFL